jgi:FAD/FMN-containing dehydrogenase
VRLLIWMCLPSLTLAAAENGSISAEHGLGVMKAPYVGYSKNETSIDMMRKIKHLFDPKGLLNPYKYIQ